MVAIMLSRRIAAVAAVAFLALAVTYSPAVRSHPAARPAPQVVPPPPATHAPPRTGTDAEIAPYPHSPTSPSREWGGLEVRTGAFPDLFLRPYFVNGDATHRVVMSSRFNNRIFLDAPGEWSGAGVLENGTDYWGVFHYNADAATVELRGARGSHAGAVEPDGLVHVEATFSHPKHAPLSFTWAPSRAVRLMLDGRIGSPRSITRG